MDRDSFLRQLGRAGLLGDEELAEAARLSSSPRAVARALVNRGLLTAFQARRALAGRAGRLVLGQYRILDLLGRGAMGRVYRAVHTAMERVVAIKVILPGILADGSAVELFTREVRAAALLSHPNIVTAFDANEVKGVRFLVMEYVEGQNLQNLVKQQGPLPTELACDLIGQAAAALQYAHERGMVHRDIKPANLLVAGNPGAPGGRPVVKVVDFGLARVRGAGGEDTIRVEPGAVFGTADYISPEQANDVHAVDIRSDLYSLGCVFYYALAGRVPFPGGNPFEKLLKHLMERPEPLRGLRPDVPAAVEAVVDRLLAKDRAARFQTPAELADELAALRGAGASPPAPAAGPGPAGAPPVPDDAQETAPLVSAPAVALLPDGVLREKFRRWTQLVEHSLRRRGALRGGKREAFAALQRELVGACEAEAAASDGPRREFFERLANLIRPWLTPEALAQAELEIHSQLVRLFQEAERQLAAWLAAGRPARPGAAEDTAQQGWTSLFRKVFGR